MTENNVNNFLKCYVQYYFFVISIHPNPYLSIYIKNFYYIDISMN